MIGGKKLEKFHKGGKSEKFDDWSEQPKNKKKHHDKSFYRLVKEDEYEFGFTNTKANKRN